MAEFHVSQNSNWWSLSGTAIGLNSHLPVQCRQSHCSHWSRWYWLRVWSSLCCTGMYWITCRVNFKVQGMVATLTVTFKPLRASLRAWPGPHVCRYPHSQKLVLVTRAVQNFNIPFTLVPRPHYICIMEGGSGEHSTKLLSTPEFSVVRIWLVH